MPEKSHDSLTFVPTTRFFTPSMYFDPVFMSCENMVLIEEEEEPEARDWARGLDASLVNALHTCTTKYPNI